MSADALNVTSLQGSSAHRHLCVRILRYSQPCFHESRQRAKLLSARSSEAAAALRTHDDVCSAFAAARDADGIYDALHALSGAKGSLDLKLTHVRGKHLSRCALTVHVESRTIQCCFNCHSLLALHHLLLCLASCCREHDHQCQKHVSLFHNQ